MCSLVVGMVSHVHTYICYIHIYTKAHQIVHIKYVQFTYVNYTLITLFLKSFIMCQGLILVGKERQSTHKEIDTVGQAVDKCHEEK